MILFLSFLLHFFYFHHPQEVVFDEVHKGKYIFSYLKGEHFFNIHPPLAELLFAGIAKIFRIQPNFDFNHIGEKYPSSFYLILRALPNLLGTFLPIIFYFLGKEIFSSQKAGIFCALSCCFDNAFLCQSRFILTDIFYIFFGLLGILFYLYWKRKKKSFYLILSALFWGASFSVKWQGIVFWGICLSSEFLDFFKKRKFFWKNLFFEFLLLPFLIYFLSFFLHFSLLKNPGPGDAFYHNFWEKNIFERIISANLKIFWEVRHFNPTHIFSSEWYEWPISRKPIFYWQNENGEEKIYFLGNPFLWLCVLLGIAFLFFEFLLKILKKKPLEKWKVLLFSFYFLNMLLLSFSSMPKFLYHYLPSLSFGILILGNHLSKLDKKYQILFLIFLILNFYFYAPLSYGLPLKESEFNLRFFNFWR